MNKVVKKAISQIDYKESPAGSNRTKYGREFGLNGEAWCAIFLWWCFKHSGRGSLFPHNSNAAYAQDEVVSKCGGKWIMKKNKSRATRQAYLKKAKPGDIVTFDFGAFDAYRRHIGIVKEVKGNYIICIEGNTSKTGSQSNGGMVCEKDRSYTSICAAVRPAYSVSEPVQTDEKPKAEETISKKVNPPTKGDKCLDLSDWQGELSVDYFRELMKKGINCVIFRASYTKLASPFRLRVDAHFHHNIKNAIKAGLPHIGAYHFNAPLNKTEAVKEAEFFLNEIKPYKKYINLPLGYDCEFGETKDARFKAKQAKSIGKTGMGEIIAAFLGEVKKAGYEPMLYANLVMFNNYLPATIYKKYKIWIAQYYQKCQYKHPYYLWQYTSNNGKLDENVFGSQGTPVETVSDETSLPARGYYKFGDKGPEIEWIQKRLNTKNKGSILPDLVEDGEWGEKTDEHVALFQDVRHLTIDREVGKKTIQKLDRCKTNKIMQAVNWIVSITRDNSFAYGTGERAHRGGCYFCGTNTGPVMKKKEKKGEPHYVKDSKGKKHTYEKTYCCNPLVFSAFAHGAKDSKMLAKCKAGGNATTGMDPKAWKKYGFEILGKCSQVPYEDLQAGDVLMVKSHVCMYTGDGWIAEAGGGNWSANSIRHTKVAKSRYNKYRKDSTGYVVRYKG